MRNCAGYLWAGTTNANWNTTTANWTGLAGQGSTYTNGFPAIFTDAGTKTNITIAGTIQPSKVWFDNFAVPYTFSGAAIAGSASVTLAGTGSVTFNSANTYTGGTTVYNGSLTAGASDADSVPDR